MNILIIYDSTYGNTEKIAQAMARALQLDTDKIIPSKEAKISQLKNLDLLIIGSPTYAGKPTPTLKEFMTKIPDNYLSETRVLAFDTAIRYEDKNFFFKNFIKMLGYAAKHTAKELENKGAEIINVETFFVKDKEGPLEDGEINRAKDWVKNNYK